MITLHLYAAGSDELLASMPVQAALVNRDARLIGGVAIPWNVIGHPAGAPAGGAMFRANSVTVPEDASWVKLLINHDRSQSVGSMTEWRNTASGALAAYRVAPGPDGDRALDAVDNGTRDALSIGVEVSQFNRLANNAIEVITARLRETSLVSVPAYEAARVSLAASLSTHERESLMTELNTMLELRATAPAAPAQPEPQPAPPAQPEPQPAPPAQPQPQTPAPAPGPTPAPAQPAQPEAINAAAAAFLHAAGMGHLFPRAEAPAGPPNPAAPTTPTTLHAAAAQVAQWFREHGPDGDARELRAALADIIPTDDAAGATSANGTGNGAQWLGELWTARQSRRPFIDALGTPKPLTSMKVKGWRWVTRPTVAPYAGDKAAIPSNQVKTEPAEANAVRLAGGWDVDRAFFDFEDTQFIQSLFEAATEDYAIKSNAWAGAQLVDAAADADAAGLNAASVPALLVALGAKLAPIGAGLTWLALAPDAYADLAGLTKDDVPWWMTGSMNVGESSGQIGNFGFWADASLPAGTYVGGDGRAATYYEKGKTPIQVQAVNIPNGGVDLGVFGYNGLIVNDSRALLHGTVGTGAGA